VEVSEAAALEAVEPVPDSNTLNIEFKIKNILNNRTMKKTIWIVIAALVVIACGYCWTTYNTLVKLGQGVEATWANVETQYQRRADLIPNLVSTVKGYAKHEQETLDQVIEARSKALAGGTNIEEYATAQQQVTTALGRLIAIAESYPDLKANTNFLELQAQLEGTENRIAVARNNYNEIVKIYNTKVSVFPSNLIAKIFDFEKKQLFTAAEGAAQAPKVEF
jgi:LemA protein